VRLILTAGQRNDITQAKALIDGLPAQWYWAIPPSTPTTSAPTSGPSTPRPSSPRSFAGQETAARRTHLQGRHLVECCFNKLKHFRRVATRYEKTARNFLAFITVSAIALWLR